MEASLTERMTTKLVHNERLKLTATFLNWMAVAMVAFGAYFAFAAWPNSAVLSPEPAASVIGLSLVISAVVHWTARWVLRGLKK